MGQRSAEQLGNGAISGGQASKFLFNDPRKLGKLTNFVEIDITDLAVRQGLNSSGTEFRDHVQFILNKKDIDLTDRIVRAGRTF